MDADAQLEADGSVRTHLAVLPSTEASSAGRADRIRRWAVVVLTAATVALWTAAYFRPWWSFTLFAPQYPGGLTLSVSLTGLGGDVHEIDMLNHYIGMGHLEDAAPHERALAAYAIVALCGVVLLLGIVAGRRLGRWLWLPAALLPVAFLGDSFYWLRRFGHRLNPHAPLHIPPFTPHLFGAGTIGQFHTTAVPALGFALAFAGLALIAAATVLRARVCADCGERERCHGTCPRLLVLRSRA